MKFGLNTGMRLAQFLAQVREEVGPEFKVIRESLNYLLVIGLNLKKIKSKMKLFICSKV